MSSVSAILTDILGVYTCGNFLASDSKVFYRKNQHINIVFQQSKRKRHLSLRHSKMPLSSSSHPVELVVVMQCLSFDICIVLAL